MSKIVYKVHYKVRRLINFLLWRTVRRHQSQELMPQAPIIAHLNFSKAIIKFVYHQERSHILNEVNGLEENRIVMDVGGDTGTWAMELYQRYHPRLYIFEPHPRSVEALRERFTDSNAEILPYGLGSSDRCCELSDDGMGSSIYDASRNYGHVRKLKIEIRDIRGVMDELNLEDVDLIKVNIEGGEFDLIPRLVESGLINRFRVIRIQFHDWFPNSFVLRRRIVKELAKTHDVEWSYPMVWESWVRRGPCK